MNVRFCRTCRSLIMADFRFCPYCGASTAESKENLEAALEEPFRRLAESQDGCASPEERRAAKKEALFASLEESLVRLETDMDVLIGELEREGRAKRG